MAIRTDIELWADNDKNLEVTVLDDAGAVVDISGATEITWTVRENVASATTLIEKTMSNDGGIEFADDGTDGVYTVTLAATDTHGLSGAYYWESLVTLTDGVFTGAYGYCSVKGASLRNAYCTLEEAMALMADVAVTENTTPSLATAQIIVETIARDIDGVLMGRAYLLPIADPHALAFLKTLNQYGACAAIIKSKKPIDTGLASDRGAFGYYEEKYRAGLLQLASAEFNLLGSDDDEESIFAWGDATESYPTGIGDDPFWTRGTMY